MTKPGYKDPRNISYARKYEIARYIIKTPRLTHKERAYYLGLHYGTYLRIFHEMIAVYTVYIIKDEIIHDLTGESLLPLYPDTWNKK